MQLPRPPRCSTPARPSAVLLPPLHGLHRHRPAALDIRSLGQKKSGSEPPQKQISLNHRAFGTTQPFVSFCIKCEDSPGLPLLNRENPMWRGPADVTHIIL